MKKIHMACYICDNEFFFLNEYGQVVHSIFKSIQEEEIVNSSLFREELFQFLKKNHIKISLFGKNIVFLKTGNLSALSLEKYESILKDYFKKIEFINLEKLFNIDNENGVLFITNNYIDYYFMKKNNKEYLRVPLKIFSGKQNKTLQHIFSTLYKSKKVLLLSSIENTNHMAEEINNHFNTKVTFPENFYMYIFEEYKNN